MIMHPAISIELADRRNGTGIQKRDGRVDFAQTGNESDSTIWVESWVDPNLEAVGHHPRSPYVELFWLSVLGPTSTWLLRRLSMLIEQSPDGFELDTGNCSRELGLGGRATLNTAFVRAIDRCCRFGLMQKGRKATLFVRRRLPGLTPRMIERLPEGLQGVHEQYLKSMSASWGHGDLTRAKKIADTLFECGDSVEEVERHLHLLQIHPALAHEASRKDAPSRPLGE